MLRQENLILSYAAGAEFCRSPGFFCFLKSLKNVPNADCTLCTNDMPEDIRSILIEDFNIEVIDVPKERIHNLLRDRHLAFWDYLNNHGHKYQHVLLADCKDVIFQKNPFDWVNDWKSRYIRIAGCKDFLSHFVILVSEGFRMGRSGFACIEQFEFERDIPLPFLQKDRTRWVVNGGVILGKPRAVQDLAFLLWSVTLKSIGKITDQATLNWLLRFLDDDDCYIVSHPQHDDLCLTGEGVKEEGVKPIVQEGLICNPHEKPYYIVHQWDRIDEFKQMVLALYDESNKIPELGQG